MSELDSILLSFFNHQITIKMYHFQTKTYGAHKTSDTYLSGFLEKMDRFIEIGQGIYGTVTLNKVNISIKTVDDKTIFDELEFFIKMLRKCDNIIGKYPELLNIRDEMLGDAEQLKYLLHFK